MDSYETEFPELEGTSAEKACPDEAPVPVEEPNFAEEAAPTEDAAPVRQDAPAETNLEEFYHPARAKTKKSGSALKIVMASILLLAIVISCCLGTALILNNYWMERMNQLNTQLNHQVQLLQQQIKDNSFTGNGNSISGTPNTSSEGMTPGQLYAKVVDSVVAISTNVATGSGFILSEDGFVVTNYHVVEDGKTIAVTTHDGVSHPAVLRGFDSSNDVAVLKIEATGLPAAKLGSSDDLIIGDQVAAIGNPLGELTSTLTVGYVSAKDRSVATDGSLINMLQTDAAINSGNSGGPLFNMKGEVVGITTAKYSGTSNSGATIEGIGFAIPMDDIAKKITDLVEFGYVTGAYLGVSVSNMDQAVANSYGLPMGAYVQGVTGGSCADKGGIQAKDIITSLGGITVTDVNSLTRALQNYKAGDTATATVWRGGVVLTLTLVFDEKPHD